MRTFVNFTLAILLLIAFVGSGAFFVIISKDLKLERVDSQSSAAPAESSSSSVEEQLSPSE